MTISDLKQHFQDRLKVKKTNPEVDVRLSMETRTFLQTVGLPNDDELGFFFDENMALLPNDLVQLEFGDGKSLCLDLNAGEAVCWSASPADFINSSVQQFVECLYESQQFDANILAKEVFGEYYGKTDGKPNWVAYATYLEAKIRTIDTAVFEKGYYWPAFIERMEHGI